MHPAPQVALMDMLYFNNVGRLGGSKSSTQIIHGTHDEVIPFSNGSDLHHACQKYHPLPPAWIDGATHNNLETVHSTAYMRAFRSFLQHLLANPPPDPAPPRKGWLGWVDKILPQAQEERAPHIKKSTSKQKLASEKEGAGKDASAADGLRRQGSSVDAADAAAAEAVLAAAARVAPTQPTASAAAPAVQRSES